MKKIMKIRRINNVTKVLLLIIVIVLGLSFSNVRNNIYANDETSHNIFLPLLMKAYVHIGEQDVITWFQYDQNNEDPLDDERVGNQWLRDTIPLFNAAFEGEWNWVNIPKEWVSITSDLIAAVDAGVGVPDIVETGSGQIITYYKNNTLMDLSDWAKQQSWYDDLSESSLLACTGPDGGLYCIPTAERPSVTYVWADHFPTGYPTTPEQFLIEANRLKTSGFYAWTYFGSTAYGGAGASRMVWSLISSFGGTYDDGAGNMLLNTPENIAAISFLRDTVMAGYNPETVFSGGFIEEDAFKDSSAGSIPTGLFGYRYINPLTAPDGTTYDTSTAQDMLDAIAAGDVIIRPMFAPAGKTPGCNIDLQGLGIPMGAKNLEGAYDFINWIMTDQDVYVSYVLGPGAGFPSLGSTLTYPELQTPFYQQAALAVNASVCRPWAGSLERPSEAAEIIMNVVYKLIKEDQTADIATELQIAQDLYNANN